MKREYAYKKHKDYVHMKRKYNILKYVYRMDDKDIQNNICWGPIHKLSKNKVHCSCPMCQRKTSKLGMKHADSINYDKGREMDVNEDIN